MYRGSSDVSYLTLINEGGAGAPKLKIGSNTTVFCFFHLTGATVYTDQVEF